MPQSHSRLITHLVFSTKNREPLLGSDIQPELHRYLAHTLNETDSPAFEVGGVEDHVHLLFSLSRTRTISQTVEAVKTSSSKWIKTRVPKLALFHWQTGYGAFSVSQSDLQTVITYIRNQPAHHQRLSFQDEYRRFLEKYEILYDERYLWD